MTRTLVVDGYNAMNAIDETRRKMGTSLRQARDSVTRICREYARSSGYITDVKVVFDGDDRYRYLDAQEIPRDGAAVFSRTGKGDDKIIETVRKCSRRGEVILASNDNYVRNNARSYGASVMDVRDLAAKKKTRTKGRGREGGSDRKDIDGRTMREITEIYREHLGI